MKDYCTWKDHLIPGATIVFDDAIQGNGKPLVVSAVKELSNVLEHVKTVDNTMVFRYQ